MGIRRRARETAMQALYYIDFRDGEAISHQLADFLKSVPVTAKAKAYFNTLLSGVLAFRPQLDSIIERFSNNWRIGRMSRVDRNVLRIALYEMLCRDDVPVKVIINEAVEIGKKYGGDESGSFINGILDSIRTDHEKGVIEKLQITQLEPDNLDQNSVVSDYSAPETIPPDTVGNRIDRSIPVAPGVRRRKAKRIISNEGEQNEES
jgi:N utilization substance protein B